MTTAMTIVFWASAAALLYGFVAYPSILFIANLLGTKSVEELTDFPKVSLLIAAYNEEKVLEAKLENALQIDYPSDKLEVLVGSDASDDRTNEIAESFIARGVSFFPFTERRGKPSVLNDIVTHASGEVLMLCDANVMFDPMALRHMLRHMADPKIGAVTGDVQIASKDANFGEGESAYYRLERSLQLGESMLGSAMGVDGGMYIIRRELLQPLPTFALNEEFIASMRVIRKGYRVVYEPNAVAHENATPTAAQEWRRRVRISAGSVQILAGRHWPPLHRPIEVWQFVSHKLMRWLNPLFLAAALLSCLFLVKSHPIYVVAVVGQLVFYGLAILGTLSLRFRATPAGGVPFYFTMSHIAMVLGMVQGVFGMQSTTWVQADRAAIQSAYSGS